MGLLDELEQEAARLRGQTPADEEQRAAREQVWREQLQPAAERLGQYLTQLASRMEEAKRRIRFVYKVAGYGDVVAYAEAPFQCRTTPGPAQCEVEFAMVAQVAGAECPEVVAETPGKVRLIQGLLQQHHLSGLFGEVKNANGEIVSGRFQARGRVPVSLRALASAESGQIKLTFANVEGFGGMSRSFAPDAVNEEWFDTLGRYLMRDSQSFGREAVADDLRQQLRTKVLHEQKKRELEEHLARQLLEDEGAAIAAMAATASPLALLGRIRRLFARG